MIGGYGGFGGRLSRRLADAGHVVLVGGRKLAQAEAFARTLPAAEGVAIDRVGDVGAVLRRTAPDLVIDAAGPFQDSGFQVPEACIAAGTSYVDLADARSFVSGIASLDEAARAAGVAVVSGASSVPALSGAVARRLCEGLDRVSEVRSAISASNRASAGASVAAAILSYVGQKVRLWRGGRWTSATGWQMLRRERFAVTGVRPIKRRLVALCDVPDHDLLPEALPGRPAVMFRAGTELRVQMVALWLANWPVRWGWLRSLRGLAGLMRPLQRLTAWAGTDRSAMKVTLKGWQGEAPVARVWTLIAEQGHGPEIPTLAAALVAEDVLAGRVPPGARDASGMLTLDRFEALFAGLALRHEVIEPCVSPPLYRRVVGEAFDRLPPLVRRVHLVHGSAGAAGEGIVGRGGGVIGRLVGAVVRFPPAGTYPLHVDFAEERGADRWTRHFGPHGFHSVLSQRGASLVERFGPLRFRFALPADSGGLAMELKGWSFLGLKLPAWMAPHTEAREWQEDERFRFDVRIGLPFVGEIIHYSGWLLPISAPASAACAPAAAGEGKEGDG